jgi:hypothetical protein
MLSQCNEVMKDMIWQEGNLPLGHKTTVRTGLPQGVWRAANQGVPSSKTLTAQFQDSIGELVDYSIVDKSIAELNGNVAKFRYSEDMGHVEGLSSKSLLRCSIRTKLPILPSLLVSPLGTTPSALLLQRTQ